MTEENKQLLYSSIVSIFTFVAIFSALILIRNLYYFIINYLNK
jgi:hypothetical protein